VVLWHCHYGIMELWHCDIIALSLWNCHSGIIIVALWHYGNVALWLCGIVALWHCDIIALSLCHCHRDIMALWPWHYVYLLATPVAKMYKYKTESEIKTFDKKRSNLLW
jgi:hypothetical protein